MEHNIPFCCTCLSCAFPLLRNFTLLLLLTISTTVLSQSTSEEEDMLPDIQSPQVADFMRYGNAQTCKNSGRLDFTIPLLGIADNTFSMPVSLGYNSAGFMPAKHEGIVGLNWFLNVGGVITRETFGVRDDLYETANPGMGGGLLNLAKNPRGYTNEDVFL